MRRKRQAGPVRAALGEGAPAKVNLTLRVLGRRADGYHELESLVVFADIVDRLTLRPGEKLALDVSGEFASACGPARGNLVMRAARALGERVKNLRVGRFTLEKNIPAAAGLGGGSADAAAALRLLARLNRLKRNDPRLFAAARAVGADVPVCLDPRPRIMRGAGERLSAPARLPRLHALLVRPPVALTTRAVFAELGMSRRAPSRHAVVKIPHTRKDFLDWLADENNDLEDAAINLQPVVAEVLDALASALGARLARMSGSGAACVGLFATPRAAKAAARRIKSKHPRWYVRPVTLGAGSTQP